jgi:adenylyl-sulfate kinase
MMNAGLTIWFTGLSGAGKSTISAILERELRALGRNVEVLDGDVVRTHLSKGLGFSKEDRDTNIRRIGWVCEVLSRNGVFAIAAAISPYRAIRDEIRERHGGRFLEVFIEVPLEVAI